MSVSRRKLIWCYEGELEAALRMKQEGRKLVDAAVAGPGLAKGRLEVPIDEYIESWRVGLAELRNGADVELYNY